MCTLTAVATTTAGTATAGVVGGVDVGVAAAGAAGAGGTTVVLGTGMETATMVQLRRRRVTVTAKVVTPAVATAALAVVSAVAAVVVLVAVPVQVQVVVAVVVAAVNSRSVVVRRLGRPATVLQAPPVVTMVATPAVQATRRHQLVRSPQPPFRALLARLPTWLPVLTLLRLLALPRGIRRAPPPTQTPSPLPRSPPSPVAVSRNGWPEGRRGVAPPLAPCRSLLLPQMVPLAPAVPPPLSLPVVLPQTPVQSRNRLHQVVAKEAQALLPAL